MILTRTQVPFPAVRFGCGISQNPFRQRVLAVLLFVPVLASLAWPASYRATSINVRGKLQSLAVYDPKPGARARPFQILVTSGDVGWVGLGVDIAEHLNRLGYRVVGFNARAYLSSFTGDKGGLQEKDIPGDYQMILDWAASNRSFPGKFIMIGVSEGAGLSVLGMGQSLATKRCGGVIALGLPIRTVLGWRWTDFPMWITKRDPNEPHAETQAYLKALTVPIVAINSTHDEWDAIERVKAMFAFAPQPKRFIAIEAVNHRFSDKVPDVLAQIEGSLLWLENIQPDVQVNRPLGRDGVAP